VDVADDQPAWHALRIEEALDRLDADRQGLTADEAAKRLTEHGPNRLEPPRPKSVLRRLIEQFDNVLIYVLLGSGAITALLGEWIETAVILGVIVLNAAIGFLQEGRAERALDAIRGMLAPQAVVERDGHRHTVPAEMLVPGDLVLLRAGDRVPADMRVLHAHGLQSQESALTGESEPVDKGPDPVDPQAALGDRSSMLHAGTLVTYGSGAGLVVATGGSTEIGRVTALLAGVEPLTTPLLQQMAQFGRWLSGGILVLAGSTLLFGWLLRGYGLPDMFIAAVGLAVAAIPEGLPAIMTITLAIGVTRMARRNAIIRRLPAVETLGAVTVICSDKTGTLTLNEMTVQRVVTAATSYDVEGTGYEPVGSISSGGRPIEPQHEPDLIMLARAGVLCNESELEQVDRQWQVAGNPTDGALLTLAHKVGMSPRAEHEACRRIGHIPFDSTHKFMASRHIDVTSGSLIVVKGAAERVLEMCSHQRARAGAEPIDLPRWQAAIDSMAADSMRVLAIASTRVPGEPCGPLGVADVQSGLTLLGLVGLLDPPRPEALGAIRRCRGAGIAVKMITGDHAATAAAIGARLGLSAHRTLTGRDLDGMDDNALRQAAGEVDVFARTTPEHKLRLVQALQADGHVVAMTGDGVNDAPALKRADVGIAMGRKGTEAAKEAAEMVLADDRFVSIADAVESGRTVYDNLMKTIVFALPTNGAQAFCILIAILLGGTLPITPVQILWVNMVTAVTLGLALAFEAGEPDLMKRKPRRRDAPILSPFVIWRVLFVSLLLLIASFGLFSWSQAQGADLATARTLAVNALVAGEIGYLISSRRITGSALSREGLLGSRPVLFSVAAVVLLQLAFTYLPWMQLLFETRPIGPGAWVAIGCTALTLFACVEAEKRLLRGAGRLHPA
jgi:magnesium-transporting ATPase (P-type)